MITAAIRNRWKALCFSFLLSVTFNSPSVGQNIKVVPPTPNATKLTEFYATQPGMYTGTANVSIPLYTIDFDGWKLPLSLSYNATGIRTSEEASEVGLGWALNATASISRTIRGGDDFFEGFQGRHIGYVYNAKAVTRDLGYDRFNDPPPYDANLDIYYNYVFIQEPDTQPDIFNYNFFGYSGSFVLTQKVATGDSIYVKKLTPDATSIMYYEHAKKFVIITPNGFKGEFPIRERSTTASTTIVAGSREIARQEYAFLPAIDLQTSGRFRTTTSWYLSKITSPRSIEIDFEYDLLPGDSSKYISAQQTYAEDETMNKPPVCLQTIHEHIYLKRIVSDDLGLSVDFNMSPRMDLRKNELFGPGSNYKLFRKSEDLQRYTQMAVWFMNPAPKKWTRISTVQFFQSYFNAQNGSGADANENRVRQMRSRLDRLWIDDQEYRFWYYDGTAGLPDKQTRSIDHFGFFNGQPNEHLLAPSFDLGGMPECDRRDNTPVVYSQLGSRLPYIGYGVAGTLWRVKYPTKGFSEFEYEEHRYVTDQTGLLREGAGTARAGGARIRTIKEYDSDSTLQRTREYRYTRGGGTDESQSSGLLLTPLMNMGKHPRYIKGVPGYGDSVANYYKCDYVVRSNSSIPGNNAAEGKAIGYSEVYEIVKSSDGTSYKNRYFYENRPNAHLEIPLATEGFPNLNGLLMESRNYGEDGKVAKGMRNSDYEHNEPPVLGLATGPAPSNNLPMVQYYDISVLFRNPKKVESYIASTPSTIVEGPDSISDYGNSVRTIKKMEFNMNYLLRSEETTSSDGTRLLNEYRRASDYITTSDLIWYMRNPYVNMVEPVIEQISRRNGTAFSATANLYEMPQLNISRSYSYNKSLGAFPIVPGSGDLFGSPYELKTTFEYNDHGKIKEYVSSDGVVNSFVWGYNGTLPIVHGQGIGYGTLNSVHTAASADTLTYDNEMRTNNATKKALISTYKYKPLVGMMSSTDPRGVVTNYKYDFYNRLQSIVDNNGKTVEQYEYNYKKNQPTRILNVESMDFHYDTLEMGLHTPDFYEETQLDYHKCSDEIKNKVVTLTNFGDTDLIVYSISNTNSSRFTLSWTAGLIPPGGSQKIIVSFLNEDDNVQVPFGDYRATITINSNATNTVTPFKIHVKYAARVCGLTPVPFLANQSGTAPMTVDFGVTTGSIFNHPVQIKNNGNAVHRLVGLPLDWNGTSTNYTAFTSNDFVIKMDTFCIEPGRSLMLSASYIPTGTGTHSTKVTLASDWCPEDASVKDIIILKGQKVPVNSSFLKILQTTPISLTNFMSADTTVTITIKNMSLYEQKIKHITSDNGMFTVTPLLPANGISLGGFETADFQIKFAPNSNFDPQVAHIAFNGDYSSESVGLTVNGQRKKVSRIKLSSPTLAVDAHQYGYITVTNNGNTDVTLTGVKYGFSPTGPFYNPDDQSQQRYFNGTFPSQNQVVSPGNFTTLTVQSISSATNSQVLQIQYLKIPGSLNADDQVTVAPKVRELNISAVTFGNFINGPDPAFPARLVRTSTISNTGNDFLRIDSIASNNSKFTITKPGTVNYPYLLAPNGSFEITITYNATDFTGQSATIGVTSNMTDGNSSIIVVAQRDAYRAVLITPAEKGISPHDYEDFDVKNIGNSDITFTGVKYASSINGTYTTSSPSAKWSGAFTPSANPTIGPNGHATLRVTSITSDPGSEYVQVQYGKTTGLNSDDVVHVTPLTRIINMTAMTFGQFVDGPDPSFPARLIRTSTISNTGTDYLRIDNITSNNSKFTITKPGYVVYPYYMAPNETFDITVTFNATDFTSQSADIVAPSNQTSGTGSRTVTAERLAYRAIEITPTTQGVLPHAYADFDVKNIGNTDITFSGVKYAATSGGSYTTSSPSTKWSAGFTPSANPTISRGSHATLRVQSITSDPVSEYVQIQYSKTNGGLNSADEVRVTPLDRNLEVTLSSPFGTYIPASPAPSRTVTLTNNGNAPVTVHDVYSTNGNFSIASVPGGDFDIIGGASRSFTVTYNAPGYGSQSTDIIAPSNKTSGSGSVSTTANWQQTRWVDFVYSGSTVTSTSLTGHANKDIYIKNVGNENISVSGVVFCFSPGSGTTTTSSNTYNVTFPDGLTTITPGNSLRMNVFNKTSGIATEYIRVQYNKTPGSPGSDDEIKIN